VLQIRRPQYWRIEVPVQDSEDQERAEALRIVFDKILQFEKTACPFKRAFTVELPERLETPVRKRPWTPATRHSFISLPTTPMNLSPTPKDFQCRDQKPNAAPLASYQDHDEPALAGLNEDGAVRKEPPVGNESVTADHRCDRCQHSGDFRGIERETADGPGTAPFSCLHG
jgi:Inheritance of peroxisomes protein 1